MLDHQIYIYCDGPDCPDMGYEMHLGEYGLESVNTRLRKAEWIRINGKHYCPKCKEAAKAKG